MTPRHYIAPRSREREVYDVLRTEILTGKVAPGEPLIEAQLSADLGVSKTPVREALIRLQRDGLVEIAPYRGARVTRPSLGDVKQAVEVRMWIETQVAREIARAPSPDLLRELGANIAETQAALDRDDYDAFVEAVRRFSDLLLEAHGNRYAMQVVESLRNILSLISSAFRRSPGTMRQSIDEHRAILAALAGRDPGRAEAATRGHIASIEQGAIAALSRVEALESVGA